VDTQKDKSTKIHFASWKMAKECLPAGTQLLEFVSKAVEEKIRNDYPKRYDQYSNTEK
jgi:hypothetical protein